MNNDVSKKRKNKKQQKLNDDNNSKKLTKDEEAVAKYLKFNCPTRKANLMGVKVDYFIGTKAVDMLMSSKWASGVKNTPILFNSRESCSSFLQELLNKELFHRSLKVYKGDANANDTKCCSSHDHHHNNSAKNTPESTPQARKRKSDKTTTTAVTTTTSDATSTTDDKSKRKFKLEMHENQIFLDANEPYVWIYDPATTKGIIVGLLLVFGAIGICLFPLWPSIVRDGVYYVSLAGAGFLGVILGLAVLKYIIFAIVWIATVGSVQFWLLPNLTEDVGFFESFQPLYKIKNKNSSTGNNNNKTANNKSGESTSKVEDKKVATEESNKTTTTNSEDFNSLPLDEQLIKKFDEDIKEDEDDEDIEEDEEIINDDEDDGVDEDYELVEKKDIELKNN